MKDLKNKNIWIIGASSGIGAALARELAHRGARVALSARREEKLEEVKRKLSGDNHLVLPLDVTNVEKLEQNVEALDKEFGRIDSVIFLAAIYAPHENERKDLDFIHKILNVNIGGAYNVGETMFKYYKDKDYGQIVLCGSVAGYRGLPQGQPYCSTKAAIISYAESLKVEAGANGTEVKLICPGFVETPLTNKNDFDMPFIISAEKAASYIADGLVKKSFEIHFPKVFTFAVKALKFLPYPLYFLIANKMLRKFDI